MSRSPSRNSTAAPSIRSVARAPCKFDGRTFFLDNQQISEDARKRLGDRLKKLGALVTPFLDTDVDCVVAANTGTPSAPSTPTVGGPTSTRGISLRAQLILNSKSAAGKGTLQTTPAQFAENHDKQLLSARSLEAFLSAAERREQESVRGGDCSNKRSRAGLNSNDDVDDGVNPPSFCFSFPESGQKVPSP